MQVHRKHYVPRYTLFSPISALDLCEPSSLTAASLQPRLRLLQARRYSLSYSIIGKGLVGDGGGEVRPRTIVAIVEEQTLGSALDH